MTSPKAAAQNVLIVGGGIGGLSTSIALGQQGIRSTVLERDGGAAGASIGFTARALYALRDLGILDRILDNGHHYRIGERTWWGRVYNAEGELVPVTEPELRDWEVPATSLSIQRRILHQIMREAAQSYGAEILIPHTYTALEQNADGVEVELSTGERRRFDLVVAAEGVYSTLRDRFFPEVGQPIYTGSMSFRIQLEHAPEDWESGLHFTNGFTIATNETPGEDGGKIFYLGIPNHMERRRIEQAEARQIVRIVLEKYRSKTMQEVRARFGDEIPVLVAPYEWIFVPPPLHRGRVVVLGDTAHATAPTIGSAGGMAIEDGVVLAQELIGTDDLEQALTAYAARRVPRTKLVVDTSVSLMRAHQEHRPVREESAMRVAALQRLTEPY